MTFIKQKEVVELLGNGWFVGYFIGWRGEPGYLLQKGRIGHGGESKKIHGKTFQGMRDKGLLKEIKNTDWSTREFTLKEEKRINNK